MSFGVTYINIKCKYNNKCSINQKLIKSKSINGQNKFNQLEHIHAAMTLAAFLFKFHFGKKILQKGKENKCTILFKIQNYC